MKLIGLTGGTGSGKSLVADILKRHGAYIINADAIAHEILEPDGGAYNEVVSQLGTSILDENGRIDRKKTARIVFADSEKLARHVETTHKHILKRIYKELETAEKHNAAVACLDAPLLTEAGLHKVCDAVWVVYADEPTRLSRVIRRDSLTEADALLRMNAQTPFEEVKKYADYIIDNNGGIEELAAKVEHGLRLLLHG